MYLFKFLHLHILIWAGLLMKALEITWSKPMYMQYIFPCGGGMHLLIAGFPSMEYLQGEAELRELSFEFELVCSL